MGETILSASVSNIASFSPWNLITHDADILESNINNYGNQ